eukprot:jgi/Tetstr1/453571/TSEL_040539.t1
MASGKKAADPTKATPAESLAETPAEPTETTRDTTTLALLQALALKVDALSTRLDEHDNKHKEQRDIPSDDDEANKTASRDEYRHLLCYGVYRAAAYAAAKTALATLRVPDTPTQDRVDALDLLDAAHRTREAMGDADEARLTYLRRFKAKKALTPEEQVADERLIYFRVLDTAEHERSANVVDGLLVALEDKRLGVGLAAAAKAQASTTFKRKAAERDTTATRRGRTRTRLRDRGGSSNAARRTPRTATRTAAGPATRQIVILMPSILAD